MTVHESLADASRSPYRLRIDDFLLLDGAGRFAGQGRTELLDGEIYIMNAQHRPHARIKMFFYDALRDALADRSEELAVMVEASVALSDHDAPEPDLTLTSQPDGDGLIPGSSVSLVIEVADTTLSTDLGQKAALYAAAGVPEYWVVDVQGRTVHQSSVPQGGRFTAARRIAFGSLVTAMTITGLTIATDRL